MPNIPRIKIGSTTYDIKDRYAIRAANKAFSNNTKATILPSNDLNDLSSEAAIYYVSGLTGVTNQPVSSMTGELLIIKYSPTSNSGVMQIFFQNSGGIYFRTSHGSSTISWEPWSAFRTDVEGSVISNNNYTERIPSGDFDLLCDYNCTYYLSGLTDAANQPVSPMNGIFSVLRYSYSSSTGYLQIYYSLRGEIYYRINHGSPTYWDQWNRVDNRQHALTCKIFKKVVCCGDSYTAGYIVDNNSTVRRINENYAWPHYMETLTGNRWVNCGHSGTTALTWQTAERGLYKAQLSGKTQAYILALMINDSSSDSTRHLDLGTSGDIGSNSETYYAQYSKIVRELASISPEAFIFVCTIPCAEEEYDRYSGYIQAVKDIYNSYKDTYKIHLLDLYANRNLYRSKSLVDDAKSGHYTAIGYEQFSEIMAAVLTDYINAHVTTFQEVAFIPYDSDLSRDAVEAIIQSEENPVDINYANTYLSAKGKYVVSNGKKYFSLMIRFINPISSGVNNILTSLPAPQNTHVLFYEKSISMDDTGGDKFLSYTDGWRMNGPHSSGDIVFIFGAYD